MLARRCKKLTALFLTLCMVTGMLGTGALATEEASYTVAEGETLTLIGTSNAEGAEADSWSSSDPTVATVNDGVVTGVAEGTAVITHTY